MSRQAFDDMVEILDLEEIEMNLFRGRSPQEDRQRVFGGQVAGQALVAVGRTVPEEFQVHSLHAYFIRGGDVAVPIIYQVDRTRDGRSFSTRRVVATQHGKAIFTLSASFHRDERGYEHQDTMPEAPDPESLPTFHEAVEAVIDDIPESVRPRLLRERPVDVRYVGPLDLADTSQHGPNRMVWIRADGKLPDDPLLHDCVVAYASDMMLLDTALRPHSVSLVRSNIMLASLDHAMWFHRAYRADEWLLYVQHSPSAAAGRGFSIGQIYTREGALAVSVAQEGLIRPPRETA